MERYKKASVILLVVLIIGGFLELKATDLPYRKELSPDIKFWKKIFSEVSSNQYIIHDSQYLSIIYTTVTFDPNLSERERSRFLKSIKEKYEQLLWKFHYQQGDTSDLSLWEWQVYNQFRTIKDKNKFKDSIGRIRAQQGIREKFMEGLKRSFAYLPLMEEIFEKYDMPRELIYMPHIESSFNIHAVSKARAKGMWQFMWGTARHFMKINTIVDQRFDPIHSTEAAAKLLQRNYAELNDWALAITAYNHGLAGMERAKRKFDGDYLRIRDGYLKRSFGFASKNFYPEFLAVVEIMDSLEYYFPQIGKYPVYKFKEFTVKKPINLWSLSKDLKLNIEELKELNPAYRDIVWKGVRTVKEGYNLRLPIDVDLQEVLAYLDMKIPPSKKLAVISNTVKPAPNMDLFQVSFSKPVVELDKQNHSLPQDFLFEVESNQSPTPESSFLVINYKPGVEVDSKINPIEEQLDFQYMNEAEINGEAMPVTFAKPEVNTGDIFVSRYQYDSDIAGAALTSNIDIRSENENQPTDGGLADNSSSQYNRVSKDTDRISLSEVKDMLKNRLQIKANTIVIFPNETIGHVAEWLNVSAGYLRTLNDLSYGERIYSGQTLKLEFSSVSPEQFLADRLAYHMNLIMKMFNGRSEIQLVDYTVNPGENLWYIARKRYNFPVNLLHYFNDLNKLEQLYPGDVIKLPRI